MMVKSTPLLPNKLLMKIKKRGGEAVANYHPVEFGEKIIKTALDNYGKTTQDELQATTSHLQSTKHLLSESTTHLEESKKHLHEKNTMALKAKQSSSF